LKDLEGIELGNALVIVKIYPEGPEKIEEVEKAVRELKEGKVKDVKREPIAFGMELIRAGIVIPDKQDGAMQKLEDALQKIPGVNQIEVEGITLL